MPRSQSRDAVREFGELAIQPARFLGMSAEARDGTTADKLQEIVDEVVAGIAARGSQDAPG